MLTRSEVRQVNKKMRKKDDSNLWPINGKFNATDRAIRKLYHTYRKHIEFESALEYELALEQEISNIVNSTSF